MQSEGNSSPVKWTSQTSRSSRSSFDSFKKTGAACNKVAVAEQLSSAPWAASRAPGSPRGFVINIFHVGRIVMVGHDDGFFTVFPGDNHQQVAFVGVTFLIVFPAAERRKIEIRFPSEKAVSPQIAFPAMPAASIVSR